MASSGRNKRAAERVPVAVPVYFGGHVAKTRDMSGSGVYIETDESFAPGSALEFSIDLQYARPGTPMRLACSGHIVRVERRNGRLGIAVAIDVHRFEVAEEKAGRS